MEKNNISQLTEGCVAKLFGILPDGQEVYSYTIANDNGMEATIINYGATITSLKVPGAGQPVDVVPGFDTLRGYIDSYSLPGAPYFGAVIGRYAGRIANGKFNIGVKEYNITANHGLHTLHGGSAGFGQKYWELVDKGEAGNYVTFGYISPDGEEGFPGRLRVEVTYRVTDDNELVVEYYADTTEDTVVNLTQHSYFNLEGHSHSVSGQELFVNSAKLLDTDKDNIPTGFILNAVNCPHDFTKSRPVPARIDNSFILENNAGPAASLYSSKTGIKMTVYTNQPSVHIYVGGNCFGQIKGKEGAGYHPLSGICFEAQNYPDAPNHPHFPDAVLRKGQHYHQLTRFKFENLKNIDV